MLLKIYLIKWRIICLGSFPNSRRQIEPELLRIIMQNVRLNDLLSDRLNSIKLIDGLKLIQPRATAGSLASYDDFEFDELGRFRRIYCLEDENTITGAEPIPGEMMYPKKIDVGLPDDDYNLLAGYYRVAYDNFNFFTIGKISQNLGHSKNPNTIIIQSQVNQFRRIRIGAEIFGSTYATRYLKNSYILAKFV